MRLLRDIRFWLGTDRINIILGALLATGIGSIVLGLVADGGWVTTVQSLLAITFIAVAVVVIGSRMGPAGRRRLFFTLGPSLGLAVLAFVLPANFFPFVLGGAFGWILAAQFFMQEPTLMEYREAVRHMRKQEYKEAIKVLNGLVKDEPGNLEHLDFRARLFQLNGNTKNAMTDFEKMMEVAPDDPRAYTGMSGIYVRKGDFATAREYSEKAFLREPNDPAAPHDLAMIEDRLGNSEAVVDYIEEAKKLGLREQRLLLLAHLWQARAYHRLGELEDADAALAQMKRYRQGLSEWQRILEDTQAKTVRKIYEYDISVAQRAFDFKLDSADKLFESETS
jgi:tetratricopeptide (TPR) repeat protein